MPLRRAARVCSAAAIAVAAAAPLAGCGGKEASPAIVAKSKEAYADAKARGVDMSRGPCLGVVAEDWVADVAHDPRQDVDDDPANQCAAFRNGTAHHFVELDPNGELIRSK
jgi:hypothetical protein